MAFHAILVTRDEDDIIAQSIDRFLTWADEIHVFDTGSVDCTWDIVQDLSKKDSRVRPIEKRDIWFSDSLRGYCFDKVRNRFRPGDWFVRTDTDEFYHIAPPEFVKSHIRKGDGCVYQQYYDFRLTHAEAQKLEDPEKTIAERKLHIEDRRHHYTLGTYFEPRLCRYRRHMSWPPRYTFPINAGFLARARIPIRHYPNRDPRQLRKRMELRRTMTEAAINANRYSSRHPWRESDWKALLVDPIDPGVGFWQRGDALPAAYEEKHLPKKSKRILQKFVHASLVPALDRIRYKRLPVFQPEPLDPAIRLDLQSTLNRLGELE